MTKTEKQYHSYMVEEVYKRTELPKKEIWTALYESGLIEVLQEFDGLGYHWPIETNTDYLEGYLRTSGRIPKEQHIRLDDWKDLLGL